MATVIQNKKDGKTVSYKFRAYLGRNELGEQITKYTTWHAPENLTPTKAQRAAEKAAAEWEKEIRDEYEKDLKNPERIREREIAKTRTEFSKFALESWFPVCVNDGEHKHTTVDFYRHTTNRVAEYFRGKAIQSITPLDIQKYLIYLRTEYRTKQGKPVSDKTIRHSYCVLTLIFGFAMEQEYITKNPMEKVDCPKLAKKKVDAFTKEQAEAFFSALPDCPPDFRCMMYLLITAGLRRGELLGLQWQDIDFVSNTVDVRRNITYTPEKGTVVDTPKTDESTRTIPLLPFVAAQLKEYRQRYRFPVPKR